jgi:predicted ATP-grasp superfamily ATP-dependent carboligase
MSRVLITGARAPVAMHLARLLTAAGHAVVLADSQAWPLGRTTRFKETLIRLPAPRGNLRAYGEAVAQVCRTHAVYLVVPTCEEVFYLAAARDLLGLPLPVFAPDLALLKMVHDKYEFSRLAMGLGADPGETHLLMKPADIILFHETSKRWVFKPVWSRFGERVLIRPTPETLATLIPSAADPWIAQRFLPGEELCAYAIAHSGKLRAVQAYRPLWRAGGDIGAGVAVEPVDEPVISHFVEGFVAKTNWHGQVSFDFRRDETGKLHVLECNPRATTGAHFFGRDDGLAGALLTGAIATPTRRQPQTVPLAMWLYGLPSALRSGRLAQWRRDFAWMGNLLAWPGDRATLPFVLMALAETIGHALVTGQSVKAAATADIEWNGEELLLPCEAGEVSGSASGAE